MALRIFEGVRTSQQMRVFNEAGETDCYSDLD